MERIRKVLLQSVQFILISGLTGFVYGRIRLGYFTLIFVFPGIILAGSIITLAGVIVLCLPVRLRLKDNKLKDNVLIDHSNYFSIAMEKREKKREKAYEILFIGLCVISISAIIQLVLSFIF